MMPTNPYESPRADHVGATRPNIRWGRLLLLAGGTIVGTGAANLIWSVLIGMPQYLPAIPFYIVALILSGATGALAVDIAVGCFGSESS